MAFFIARSVKNAVVIFLPIILVTIIFQFGIDWFFLFKDIPDHQKRHIEELISHLNNPINSLKSLSKKEIDQYKKDGFFIYRNAIDKNVLEALRITTRHVFENPNGLLQFLNGTGYCGWSFNNGLVLDVWGKIISKLPISEIVASLMDTSQVAIGSDVMHTTSIHCFEEEEHIQFQGPHTDQEQAPYSIEKKVNLYVFFNKGSVT